MTIWKVRSLKNLIDLDQKVSGINKENISKEFKKTQSAKNSVRSKTESEYEDIGNELQNIEVIDIALNKSLDDINEDSIRIETN